MYPVPRTALPLWSRGGSKYSPQWPEVKPKYSSNPRPFGWYGYCDPLCHLPKQPVAYPAALNASAMVRSSRLSRSPPVETPCTPPRGCHRPVRNSARVGEQTGWTKNRSNRAPSRASESTCGVFRLVLPLMLRSPHPWSSARMTTTFGLLASSAAEHVATTANIAAPRERRVRIGCPRSPILRRGVGSALL